MLMSWEPEEDIGDTDLFRTLLGEVVRRPVKVRLGPPLFRIESARLTDMIGS